jgi:putative hydrolase of the HAD superfamily
LKRKLRCALFDLDNTLYPSSCGLMKEIGNRINRYMVERLGVNTAEVSHKRDDFLRAFGTTLNALRRYYAVDPDEFLEFVHDIPLAPYLQYEPVLDGMLGRLDLRKVIFTNADAQHARRVLSRLGILRHFESIIDIHMLEFVNKPDRRAYLKALDFTSTQPEECVLIEDSVKNLATAGKLCMITVHVGEGTRADGAPYHIERITTPKTWLIVCKDSNLSGRSLLDGSGNVASKLRSDQWAGRIYWQTFQISWNTVPAGDLHPAGPRSGQLSLAGPFKARNRSCTHPRRVSDAFFLCAVSRALKGRARVLPPLRGCSGLFQRCVFEPRQPHFARSKNRPAKSVKSALHCACSL